MRVRVNRRKETSVRLARRHSPRNSAVLFCNGKEKTAYIAYVKHGTSCFPVVAVALLSGVIFLVAQPSSNPNPNRYPSPMFPIHESGARCHLLKVYLFDPRQRRCNVVWRRSAVRLTVWTLVPSPVPGTVAFVASWDGSYGHTPARGARMVLFRFRCE